MYTARYYAVAIVAIKPFSILPHPYPILSTTLYSFIPPFLSIPILSSPFSIVLPLLLRAESKHGSPRRVTKVFADQELPVKRGNSTVLSWSSLGRKEIGETTLRRTLRRYHGKLVDRGDFLARNSMNGIPVARARHVYVHARQRETEQRSSNSHRNFNYFSRWIAGLCSKLG